MRGFFGAQGNYYEADDPLNPTDLEVTLRPSEAYILGSNGKWVLDRRQQHVFKAQVTGFAREQTDHSGYDPGFPPHVHKMAQLPPHQQNHPGNASVLAPSDSNGVKYALFEFLAKNWVTLIGAAAWTIGAYTTVSTKFYDMNALIVEQGKIIESQQQEMQKLRTELKEHQQKLDLRISGLENRYNDVTLFMQQFLSKK